uniref:RING-type domain-containing protein n=1 Tax=Steinernema glaseri TaxID=37863 RepID=A0A1I7YMK3_9BILA
MRILHLDPSLPPPERRICCKCGKNDAWRLLLRECEHMICVPCAIIYFRWAIQDTNKARIKCPKNRCVARVHENDVNAILDPENRDLDHFMPKEHREWLQWKHDNDVVKYGVGGHLGKQCPICLNYYPPEAGCHYVRCPNKRCATWFCSTCERPAKSLQHFVDTTCKPGAEDLYRLFYIFKWLMETTGKVLLALSPMVAFALWVLFPWALQFGLPYFTFIGMHEKLYKGCRTPSNCEIFVFVLKSIIAVPVMFFLGFLLGYPSMLSVIPIFGMYMWIALVKLSPSSKTKDFLESMETVLLLVQSVGFGLLRQMIKDTREAQYSLDVRRIQEKAERSERLPANESGEGDKEKEQEEE